MRDGYVYVVQSLQLGWVKIGWAKDIARRMVDVARSCGTDLTLLGCFAGTQADESATQKRFGHHRLALDWFEPGADLLLFAADLSSPVRINFVGTHRRNTAPLEHRIASRQQVSRQQAA